MKGEGPRGVAEDGLFLAGPLEQAQRALRLGRVLGPPLEQPAPVRAPPRRVPALGHERLERREGRGLVSRVDPHVRQDVAVRARGLLDPGRVAADDPRPGQKQRRAVPGLRSTRRAEPGEGRVHRLLERLDGPRGHRETLERREHVRPRGRELEGPLGLARRAQGIAQLGLEHLGRSQRQRHPLGVVGALIRHRRVEPGQVGPAPGSLAERREPRVDLEVLRRDLARVPVEAPRRLVVPRLVRELRRPLPHRRGGLEVAAALGVEVPESLEPRDLLARVARHLRAAVQGCPRQVGVAEVLGGALHRVEGVGPEVRVLQQPRALRPRPRLVAVLGGDSGERRAHLAGEVPRDPCHACLEQRAELRPSLRQGVDLLEGRVGVRVVRIEVEDRAVRARGGRGVAEVSALDGSDAVVELSRPRRGAARERRRVQRDALGGAPPLAEQLVDAREQLRRVGLESERAAVERDRTLDLAARREGVRRAPGEHAELRAVDLPVAEGPGEDPRPSLGICARRACAVEALEPLAHGGAGAHGLAQTTPREIQRARWISRGVVWARP